MRSFSLVRKARDAYRFRAAPVPGRIEADQLQHMLARREVRPLEAVPEEAILHGGDPLTVEPQLGGDDLRFVAGKAMDLKSPADLGAIPRPCDHGFGRDEIDSRLASRVIRHVAELHAVDMAVAGTDGTVVEGSDCPLHTSG